MIAKMLRQTTRNGIVASDARLIAGPHVSVAVTQGDTVLLDRSGGAYYVLNESGALLWDLLKRGTTLADMVDALDQQYDAPRDQLEVDAVALTRDLLGTGLIRREIGGE